MCGQKNRAVYTLLIINKAGGLIYQRDFTASLQKLSTNDYLVLAGTFHGVHAITRSLTPAVLTATHGLSRNDLSGIEVLESGMFKMTCFQTVSGTKFLLFTEPGQQGVEAVIQRCYEIFTDYVLKNPFYSLEMPVRCEGFDRQLGSYLKAR